MMDDPKIIVNDFLAKQRALGVLEEDLGKAMGMILQTVTEITTKQVEEMGTPEALEKLKELQAKMVEKGQFDQGISDEEGNLVINAQGDTLRSLFVKNLKEFIEKLG